jgi:hypothetical protein
MKKIILKSLLLLQASITTAASGVINGHPDEDPIIYQLRESFRVSTIPSELNLLEKKFYCRFRFAVRDENRMGETEIYFKKDPFFKTINITISGLADSNQDNSNDQKNIELNFDLAFNKKELIGIRKILKYTSGQNDTILAPWYYAFRTNKDGDLIVEQTLSFSDPNIIFKKNASVTSLATIPYQTFVLGYEVCINQK